MIRGIALWVLGLAASAMLGLYSVSTSLPSDAGQAMPVNALFGTLGLGCLAVGAALALAWCAVFLG